MTDLARVEPLSDQWRRLAEQICPEADRFALEYAGEVSQRLGLSMFTSPAQIVLIGRWDSRVGKQVFRPQVTVDGRLALAVRTGHVIGVEGPEFTGPREQWTNQLGKRIWVDAWDCKDEGAYPRAARYLIWVTGWVKPVNGTAPWLEFAQRDRKGNLLELWKRMPTTMLAKSALSLGLRRSGVENLPADIAVGYEGDSDGDGLVPSPRDGTPGPAVATGGRPPVLGSGRSGTTDHHMVEATTPQDPYTCACGEQFSTMAGFHAHRRTMAGEPPMDVYDDSPESRGDVDDLQPTSYEDPGRPFDDEETHDPG